jgi:8-oxo-dGTP diphosphatase
MSLERVAVSVDVACFALDVGTLKLLVVQRRKEPFSGAWALPGGIVGPRERLASAAQRLLLERTGMAGTYLEQLYTFDEPDRDPRGRTLSVAYFALLPTMPDGHAIKPGRMVDAGTWHSADALPTLAFDHGAIAAYARQRLAQKITYVPLAFHLLPEKFTMADLRHVHEAIEGRRYPHASNFQTLMRSRWALERVPGELDRRTKRPAQQYRYVGLQTVGGSPQVWTNPDGIGNGH